MTSSTLSISQRFAVPMALLAAATIAAGSAAAQTMVAGWIDVVGAKGPTQSLASLVKITRKGAEVPYDDTIGLRSCDRLRLVDANAVVRITLSNKERLRLDAKTPELTLPCDPAGVTQQLAAFLGAVWGGAEKRRITATAAASRSSSRSRPPIVPALAGDRSEVAAGERALYVAWKGGRAPYSIRIVHHESDSVITASQDISTRSATLPIARFAPGRYVLIITDGDGRMLRDEQLYVVAASTLPSFPRALADAAIPEDAKRLYYADFLTGFGDGRFCFEALQQAASIAPQTTAAREWLAGWDNPE